MQPLQTTRVACNGVATKPSRKVIAKKVRVGRRSFQGAPFICKREMRRTKMNREQEEEKKNKGVWPLMQNAHEMCVGCTKGSDALVCVFFPGVQASTACVVFAFVARSEPGKTC